MMAFFSFLAAELFWQPTVLKNRSIGLSRKERKVSKTLDIFLLKTIFFAAIK